MKKKFTFLGFLAGCVFPLAGATTAQPLNTPFQIYMQADGDRKCHLDKSEMMMKVCGRSPSRPVRTLSQVQTILANHLFDQPDWSTRVNANVEVRISATKPYYGHTIDWYVTNESYTISFMPSDYQYGMGISGIAGRPVFDGAGSRDWFFQLDSTKGEPTNLRFYYLRIQGYVPGAIYLRGDPNDWQKWNGYNLVYGCYFYNLGNQNDPFAEYGFGAVTLKNSDYNTIRNNFFRKLVNVPDGNEKYIHGVYLLNNSGNNVIQKNNFSYISGDPIKVRDYSNYNKIYSNSFVRTGHQAFLLDAPKADDPTECNSWRNEFRNNTPLSCGYHGQAILLFKPYPRTPGARCPALQPLLYASDNDPELCP
jgi:hypothetical protein